jgi:N-acetylglucosaminyldiphosphoundecaprenol N-acetyl-beta-D-mannosaminyltransferase
VPRVALDTLPIDLLSTEEALEWIVARAHAAGPMAQVTTVNLNFLTHARADAVFAHVLRHTSALNLIDGWPVAWLLRRQGLQQVPRAPGSDLTPALLRSPAMRGSGVFLLGDAPETLSAVRARAEREGWEETIRGAYSPSRAEVDDEVASERLVERINRSGARVLLVGFGVPREELWLARWAHRLAVAVGIGIGGSFKFVAWPRRRAPVWMRRLNLEWLHRLALEPGRLGPRYAKDALELARLLLDAWRPLARRSRISGSHSSL